MESHVSHNNDRKYYRIAIDTAKEGDEIFNLTEYFKARVGDRNYGLQMTWYEQGSLKNVKGLKPYIHGNVGHYSIGDDGEIIMAPDASVVSYVGNPGDTDIAGRVVYHFPEQMFPQEGIFYGFIGLIDDSDGDQRLSGVNIWFKVLAGVAYMGKASAYYIGEMDKLIHNSEERIRQLLDQGQKDVDAKQAALQAIVDDYKAKMSDLIERLNAQGQTANSMMETVKSGLSALETKIQQDGLFTQAEADQFKQKIENYLKNNAVNIVDNVESLKTAATFAGETVKTRGFYHPGDGGGADYLITSDKPDGLYQSLDNGLYARLNLSKTYNVLQIGVVPDSQAAASTNTIALQNLMDYPKDKIIVFPAEHQFYFDEIIINSQDKLLEITGSGQLTGKFKTTTDGKRHSKLRFTDVNFYFGELSDDNNALSLAHTTNPQVDNCSFTNCNACVVADDAEFQNIQQLLFTKNRVNNCNYTIYSTSTYSSGPVVQYSLGDLTFTDNVLHCNVEHLHVEACDGAIVSNNSCFFPSYPTKSASKENNIYFKQSTGVRINGNSLFEAGFHGVLLDHCQASSVTNNSLQWGGQRSQQSGEAIMVVSGLAESNSSLATITGNTITFNSAAGVRCSNTNDFVISNNHIFEAGGSRAKIYYYGSNWSSAIQGIQVDKDCSNGYVYGNYSPHNGIQVESTTTSAPSNLGYGTKMVGPETGFGKLHFQQVKETTDAYAQIPFNQVGQVVAAWSPTRNYSVVAVNNGLRILSINESTVTAAFVKNTPVTVNVLTYDF